MEAFSSTDYLDTLKNKDEKRTITIIGKQFIEE